ncbi:glutathione S-transferase family protein [Sphingomonas faeni]|uniref:glutathione S-transferase family protein n=1 Tax=Sphingomonas faeni TaxID=185950 RepID=UPI0020C7ED0D|nr:glutathione S-transferase family protein [Sphingomonas faeni]MCP8892802.1 glutathione S-transferase family protein [Sphingomonas faeni]
MTLTLYTNPMSRGRIARWMLEEVGAEYETVVLDYASTMKAEPFLSINPMGKVPTIVHNGQTVTECAAICAYLAEAFPDADLAPHANERAAYYRWLFYAAGPVEAATANRALGVVPTDSQERMVGYGNFETMVAVLEQAVGAHDYIAGDCFTAADVYVGSQVIWGQQFDWLPKRDAFANYAERLKERPAYIQAGALDDALIPVVKA